jgi:hypothetical protein
VYNNLRHLAAEKAKIYQSRHMKSFDDLPSLTNLPYSVFINVVAVHLSFGPEGQRKLAGGVNHRCDVIEEPALEGRWNFREVNSSAAPLGRLILRAKPVAIATG